MLSASFIDSRAGRIFCTRWDPDRQTGDGAGRSLLILPPFGEEMNKSRHLLAGVGRAVAAAGASALLPDLYGTGDSEGDFGDATITAWRADVDAALGQLGAGNRIVLVGVRFGALLAADAALRHRVAGLLLVQPMIDGRTQLNQLMRLRLAAGMAAGGERERSSDLRARLAAGESLEFAGYRVNGTLAEELEALELASLAPLPDTPVGLIEVAADLERPAMPALAKLAEGWRLAGVEVQQERVLCDAFWAAQELVHCPGLAAPVTRLAGL